MYSFGQKNINANLTFAVNAILKLFNNPLVEHIHTLAPGCHSLLKLAIPVNKIIKKVKA